MVCAPALRSGRTPALIFSAAALAHWGLAEFLPDAWYYLSETGHRCYSSVLDYYLLCPVSDSRDLSLLKCAIIFN